MLQRIASASVICAALCATASAQVTTYGTACHDNGGTAPTLASSLFGAPIGGSNLTISVSGGVPNSSFLLFLGLAQANLPLGYGCDLLMPSIVANIGLPLDPGGALSFAAPLPSVPFTFSFTMQAFCIDPSTQLGASSTNGVQVTLNPNPAPAGLVINEVDYDQPGTDATEFVEILNPTSGTISLTGISMVLVNGSNNLSYVDVDLGPAGSLLPGEYLVIGQAGAVALVPSGTKTLLLPVVTNGTIQNGSPDGVALVDKVAATLIDALSYEGSMTAVTITGVAGTFNLVEGTATTFSDSTPFTNSMIRFPNGSDSNDASADWWLSALPSPGAANTP
ncbi:MAG: lamin tail domain-containing protein [Planctomycetes bacterium]|nr:lamin tail domain-containing protein [Planctomycetota bacterium]